MKKLSDLASAVLVIMAYVLFFLLLIWGIKATAKKIVYEPSETRTIQAGETLWSICKEYKPEDVDLREYIFEVENHNGITANIRAGQTIELLKVKEG